jgi:hypothetical protein
LIVRTSAVFALFAAITFSQTVTTGEVTGTVMDPSGAVIPGASIVLKSVDTGESRAMQSNSTGVYRFVFVKPGTYNISASSAGLKSDSGRLIAAVGQVEIVDLNLKPDQPKEVVLVTDAAPLLNADNANITYTVSQRELELLPLPGGDLVGVAYATPTVVLNNRYGNGNFAAEGLGSMSTRFTLNGVDNMDPEFNTNNYGTTGMLLGVNEIQEVSIIQNPYEGQYGRQAGTQINYVTKSGSNVFHGNLLYNYNDTILNANDFFNNSTGVPRPKAVSNQYGAALGGPIVRDKLFFFADTEGLRFAAPGSLNVIAIPSPALESYALRSVQPSQVPLYQKMFDVYNAAPGHENAVPVTNGPGLLQDKGGALGCGRLAGTPTGTDGVLGRDVSCAQAWGSTISSNTSEWLLSARVDYNLNSRHRLFFRFKTDHGSLPVSTSPINPAFNIVSTQPDYEGQINHTYILTSRLVNNFIGAVTYNDYVQNFVNLADALQLFPLRIYVRNGGANGSFGLTPIGAPSNNPLGRRSGQLQLIDDISYSAGRHSLKAGLNYRYNRLTDLSFSPGAYEGQYSLRRLDELTSGVLNPASGSNYFQLYSRYPVQHLRLHNFALHIQDQWALTQRVKLSATLRIDHDSNPDCLDRCFSRMNTPFPQLAKGVSIPYNASIQTGLENAFYHGEPVVFQPRVSLVYSPVRSKGTVVRGGIGLFADSYPTLFISRLAGNVPNVFFSSIHQGLVATGIVPGSAASIASASASAFQNGFANGATLSGLQQSVAPAFFSPPGYYSLPSAIKTPKYLEWSLEIQQQIGRNGVFIARYAGNHGYDVFLVNPNVNASADPSIYITGFGGLPSATPDPRFQVVSQLSNKGFSNYDALVVLFRRTLSHGLQSQVGYNWSHALDTISNGGLGGLVSFSYDSVSGQISPANSRSRTYGNADYDIRHQLTGQFLWDIPVRFQNRTFRSIFGGWSAGAKLNAHTGTPFSVINSDIAGQLSNSFGGTVLANVLDSRVRTSCSSSAVDVPCFTSAQFGTTATQIDLGNRSRNSFRAPAVFNLDSSLYKSIAVTERLRVTLGLTAYNVLNHPNFADPNSDVANSGLGLVTSTTPNPSGPYGLYGGPSGRAIILNTKIAF